MQVSFSRRALDDLEKIGAYISQYNPAAAARLVVRLRSAVSILSEFPFTGRARPDGGRELTVVPPYKIVYDVAEGMVNIVTIFHSARDPADDRR